MAKKVLPGPFVSAKSALMEEMENISTLQKELQKLKEKHADIISEVDSLSERLASARMRAKELAKAIDPKEPICHAGLSVSIKKFYTYDFNELFRMLPDARKIDGILKHRIDANVVKAAVRAGVIPEAIADAAKTFVYRVEAEIKECA